MGLILLIIAAQAGAIAPGDALSDPLLLFQKACLSETFAVAPGRLSRVSFAALPREERIAIAAALQPSFSIADDKRQASDAISNPVYRSELADTYLVTVTAEPIAGAARGETCAVIWKGQAFYAAEGVAIRPFDAPHRVIPRGARVAEDQRSSSATGPYFLTATYRNGWTSISVLPIEQVPAEWRSRLRLK